MRLPPRTDDQVRIGVAITVPAPFGPALQAARGRFGDPAAPLIPPHITLLGPTVVDLTDVALVEEHLTQVAARHEPFVVHLRGTGTFRPVSPVVFVQVVDGIAGCEGLERDVRSGPLTQELRFNYHPHVTVAHEVPDAALDAAFDEMAVYEARFDVTGLSLYEHGDDGVWRPERVFPLTGAAEPAHARPEDAGPSDAS